MSELTSCNHCNLRRIRQNAAPGVRVTTAQGKGDWTGWIVVNKSDEDKPVAYFKALTDRCVC